MLGKALRLLFIIVFVGYLHEKDMEKLAKVNKVKVIVSLLNPSLPFERSLLEKEKKLVRKFGFTFYNVPLSFINLESPENYRSMERIRNILERHKNEKVYIHCYLGRHRVGFVAQRLIGVAK